MMMKAIRRLDEPTTYLGLAHEFEMLDLLAELDRAQGGTTVIVLHDLYQACRYAHHLGGAEGWTGVRRRLPAAGPAACLSRRGQRC